MVTIGLPTYNGGAYVETSIRSLLAQTYPHFSLIISDDNSSDNTGFICQEFAKKDKRIHFFRQKKRLGFVNNFNFVLAKARSKYFMWAGQDDLWDKTYLKTLVHLFQINPDAVSAVSNYQNLYDGKKYTIKKHFVNNLIGLTSELNSLLHFIHTNNLSYFYGLHKTAVLKKIGGYQIDSRPFFKSSDYLTIFRILVEGRMVFSDRVLFFKRDTGTFTQRFRLLQGLRFSKKVRSALLRYSSFPISFLFDLTLSIRHTTASGFSNVQKFILIFHIIIFYFKRNLDYCISIFQGLWYVMKGTAIPILR